jgi:hypothetical protein
MAFNGSGTFVRVRNWVNDAAAGIKIRADFHDSEDDNFATGLSQCITKDGQTTVTANLPMATYRHTNVGAATARTHYARYDQVQDGKTNWSDAGGTADAITASYNPPITALVDGQICYVRAGAENATTTPTFSPDSLTARTIVKYGGNALEAGEIKGDGHELILRYDLANTRWELLNPHPNFSGSNTGDQDAEDVPYDPTDNTVITDTDVQSALNQVEVQLNTSNGADELVRLDGDGKLPAVDASALTGLIFTESFEGSEITINSESELLSESHSLSGVPKLISAVIRCKSTDKGYAVGDEVDVTGQSADAGSFSFGALSNATIVGWNHTASVLISDKTGGSLSAISNAKWKVVLRAYY